MNEVERPATQGKYAVSPAGLKDEFGARKQTVAGRTPGPQFTSVRAHRVWKQR